MLLYCFYLSRFVGTEVVFPALYHLVIQINLVRYTCLRDGVYGSKVICTMGSIVIIILIHITMY